MFEFVLVITSIFCVFFISRIGQFYIPKRNWNGLLILNCSLISVCYFFLGISIKTFFDGQILIILLIISYIDMLSKLIHHRFLLIWFCLLLFAIGGNNILAHMRLIGAFSIAGLMLIANIIYPNSFGGGDIKWMIITGYFVGFIGSVNVFLFALFSATIFGIAKISFFKNNSNHELAFAPFLCLGFIFNYSGISIINQFIL